MQATRTAVRLILAFALALSKVSSAGAADLTVRIEEVKSGQGKLMIAIYDSAHSFLTRPVGSASVAAASATVDVVFNDLPAGEYGIALFHDANDNNRMDSNAMGIPIEQYAFSNNAWGNMEPPNFEQVKFTVPPTGTTTTIITLQ
jgi:uncharacterized protein (DUF2141 family)